MASSLFAVTEHVIDTQHIREYPRSTATQDATLKLVVKKYTPLDNPDPRPGDVTIIGSHGIGFPKEVYEPLWEDILSRSAQDGFRIRAIWMADAASQGASAIENEQHMGSDPSWLDHSRDLLYMVNHFREEMPQPIMGLGHSAGGTQLVYLSLIHPRLLTSLILLECYLIDIDKGTLARPLLVTAAKKPDIWASHEIAAQQLPKYFKFWDRRARDRWIQYAYRQLPTAIHPHIKTPDSNDTPVTLATTKHQELLHYTRANFNRNKQLGLPDEEDDNEGFGPSPPHDPLFIPDMIDGLYKGQLFYRTEPSLVFRLLPHVRPSVLFVSGGKSELSTTGMQTKAVGRTGTGFGGSGGVAYNRVKHVVIEKTGHMVPMEKVAETAGAVGSWIGQQMQRWREDQHRIADGWEGLSLRDKSTASDHFLAKLENNVVFDTPLAKKRAVKL